MDDPMKRPVVRVDFVLPDGDHLVREWTFKDCPPPETFSAPPPEWLLEPRRAWPHPQDPITFTGTVRTGFADEARQFVEALDG